VFEGDSITFTITTTNFNDGLLAWVITGVDSTVINGVMRSTVVISGGTASVIVNTQNNAVTEGTRNLVFTVYTPDYVTSLTSTSVSVLENVIITVNTTSVNEPGTVTFTISSAAYSGVIYWSFAGSSGGITTADFSDAAGLSGTVTISPSSPQTVTKNIVADQLTEGAELLWMSGCTGNYVTSGGILVAKSPYVTINDTSLSPPYVVSVSPTKGPKTGGTISSADNNGCGNEYHFDPSPDHTESFGPFIARSASDNSLSVLKYFNARATKYPFKISCLGFSPAGIDS
jgi:hypothetical protein